MDYAIVLYMDNEKTAMVNGMIKEIALETILTKEDWIAHKSEYAEVIPFECNLGQT